MSRLKHCARCRENSVAEKVYTRKRDGAVVFMEWCINPKAAGCGYKFTRTLKEGRPDENKARGEAERKGAGVQLELF